MLAAGAAENAAAKAVAAAAAAASSAAVPSGAGQQQTSAGGSGPTSPVLTTREKPGRAISPRSSPAVSAAAQPPAPLWHLPPAAVLTWCGDNRAWQAAVHLASIEMLPEGADTPDAATTLTAKAARLLADADADEARLASASLAPSTGGQAPLPAPRLLQRTSTTMDFALPTSAAATAMPGQQWMLLGKPYGSGTVVTAANTALAGTGIALPVSPGAVASVTGLLPNVRYNFAWVWCAPPPPKVPGKTQPALGPRPAGAISASTPGIVAATPLPLDLLWARLAAAALRAGDRPSYAAALRHLSAVFLAVAIPRPVFSEQASATASICLKVSEPRWVGKGLCLRSLLWPLHSFFSSAPRGRRGMPPGAACAVSRPPRRRDVRRAAPAPLPVRWRCGVVANGRSAVRWPKRRGPGINV